MDVALNLSPSVEFFNDALSLMVFIFTTNGSSFATGE